MQPYSLQCHNPHTKDLRIKFDQSSHIYYVDQRPISTSVTSFVSKFFSEFDSDRILTDTNIDKWRSVQNLSDPKTYLVKFISEYFNLYSSDCLSDPDKFMSKKKWINQIIAEIFKLGWFLTGKTAAMRGQAMHSAIETILNMHPNDISHVQNFEQVEKNVLGLYPDSDCETIFARLFDDDDDEQHKIPKEINIYPNVLIEAIGKSSQERQSINTSSIIEDLLTQAIQKTFPTVPMALRNLITGALRKQDPIDVLKEVFKCIKIGGIPPNLFSIDSPECTIGSKEVRALADWMMLNNYLRPYRTEFSLFSEDHPIAGQADALFQDVDKNFVLVDWKRTDKLLMEESKLFSFESPKHAMHPFETLQDSTKSKYIMQLSLYAFILKKYYQIQVKECRIVCIHPNLTSFYEFVFSYPSENCSDLMLSNALDAMFPKINT